MRSFEQIILRPIITEKTTDLKAADIYVFSVLSDATKVDIKNAVENVFKVKVVSVNTINSAGRRRQTGRSVGKTAKIKKAYVKLASGQKIDMLEGMM